VTPQTGIVKNARDMDLFCHALQHQKGSSTCIRKEKFYIILLNISHNFNKNNENNLLKISRQFITVKRHRNTIFIKLTASVCSYAVTTIRMATFTSRIPSGCPVKGKHYAYPKFSGLFPPSSLGRQS
jgi:hypothetical protein